MKAKDILEGMATVAAPIGFTTTVSMQRLAEQRSPEQHLHMMRERTAKELVQFLWPQVHLNVAPVIQSKVHERADADCIEYSVNLVAVNPLLWSMISQYLIDRMREEGQE